MKFWVVCLFLFLSGQTFFGQSQKFEDKVLSDFKCSQCFYIALDIKSDKYTGKSVIQNNELYFFLKKLKGLSKRKYKTYVKKLISSKTELRILNAEIDETGYFLRVKGLPYRFWIVEESSKINTFKYKDRNKFIKTYFDKDMRIKPVDSKLQYGIVHKLFGWNIATKIQDTSGSIIIFKKSY